MTDKANAGDNSDGNERKVRWTVGRRRRVESEQNAEKQAKSFN